MAVTEATGLVKRFGFNSTSQDCFSPAGETSCRGHKFRVVKVLNGFAVPLPCRRKSRSGRQLTLITACSNNAAPLAIRHACILFYPNSPYGRLPFGLNSNSFFSLSSNKFPPKNVQQPSHLLNFLPPFSAFAASNHPSLPARTTANPRNTSNLLMSSAPTFCISMPSAIGLPYSFNTPQTCS